MLLISLGLALRLGLGGCQGTMDMDWWKSWIVYAYDHSLISLYGSSDTQILSDVRRGVGFDEIQRRHAREVPYRVSRGNRTVRQRLWVAQPPLYVYALMVAGGVYRVASGGLDDSRWFNFSINLLNLVSAAAIALMIERFLRRTSRPDLAMPTALAFWLNPLVLLNAPVQGYLDQLCAVWLVASLLMLYERRLFWAYALFTVSLLMKPTGLMIAPVLLAVAIHEHGLVRNLKAWGLSLAIVLAAWAPFAIGGHALSVPLGLARLGMQLDVVSRKAINLWYIFQYFVLDDIGEPWWSQVSRGFFGSWTGVRPDRLGTLAFGVFTSLNLAFALKALRNDRLVLLSAAGLQMLGSYAFRTGQHVNHYFLAIPLLAVVALTSRPRLVAFGFVCCLFFIADVVFYGFGRDTNPYSEKLHQSGMQSVTLLLAGGSLLGLVFVFRAAYPKAEAFRWFVEALCARGSRLRTLSAATVVAVVLLAGGFVYARAERDPRHAAATYYFETGRTVLGARGRSMLEKADFRRADYEEQDGMMIVTTEGDPQMLFRAVSKRRSCAYVLRLVITPPEQTVLQFFSLPDKEAGFVDERSRELLLRPGKNEVLIALTRQEFRSRLRLDFGEAPGRYLIDDIALRAVRRGCQNMMNVMGPKRAVSRLL